MKVYSVLLIIIFSLALVSNVIARSLVSNRSFEAGTGPPGTLGVGSTGINSWEIVASTIDYVGSYWTNRSPAQSLSHTFHLQTILKGHNH
jgi:hypothetical protein